MADETPWMPDMVASVFSGLTNMLQFEDSSRLMLFNDDGLFLSKDSGKYWQLIDLNDAEGNQLGVIGIQEFDYDKNMAIAFTSQSRQFYTLDQGETWQFFDIPKEKVISAWAQLNYANRDMILFEFQTLTDDGNLEPYIAYTKDRFATGITKIDVDDVHSCRFTKTNPLFTTGEDSTMVCLISKTNPLGFLESSQVVTSIDFFESVSFSNDPGLSNLLISKIVVEGPFVVLTVGNDRYSILTSSKLFISKDGFSFKEAKFADQNRDWSYKILSSDSNLLYVGAIGKGNDFSIGADIYRSEYNGEYFEKILSDVPSFMMQVMILKVETLDGVWIAGHKSDKFSENGISMETKITIDDGKSWNLLKSNDDDDCDIENGCSVHLSWFSHRAGDGKIVSGQTPGILVGVGNTGENLSIDMQDLKTFVSRDGGFSWNKISETPSFFEFGDVGNIIVTIPANFEYFFMSNPDSGTDHFSYSLDQGETWTEVKFDAHVVPLYFVNNEDNTDLKFVLNTINVETGENLLYTIDFSSAFDRTCDDSDVEEWIARIDPNTGNGKCVYGHYESFFRRKAGSKCFINKVYQDLKKVEKPCKCTIEDTQCEYGFNLRGTSCEPNVAKLSERYCKDGAKKVKLTSRLITPGNLCSGGITIDKDDYQLNCDSKHIVDGGPNIFSSTLELNEEIQYYQYFENDINSTELKEDTLVILSNLGHIFISFDGGKTVANIPSISKDAIFLGFQFNPYYADQLFLFSKDGQLYYSNDRGHTFGKVLSPYGAVGQRELRLSFSKTESDKFILLANTGCALAKGCIKRAVLMNEGGTKYIELPDGVNNCVFGDTVFESEVRRNQSELIICDQVFDETSEFSKLISSNDVFAETTNLLFEKIVGFTTSNKYMVVGEVTSEDTLRALVSLDGSLFSEVNFPHDYDDLQQRAYTILDTASGELLLHLTTSSEHNKEYGALLKGNYNGTLFTTIQRHVNRNFNGFADFEDVKSLEGLQLINVVINVEEMLDNNEEKKLMSLISHNDGATWSMLPPPTRDSDGKQINCKGCGLHLHSYTERIDPSRDTFGSASALGMLFGLGNVGMNLSPIDGDETSLYFSRDGGISWKEVAKGRYMWEFGDQGTLLVVAKYDEPIKTIKYSQDMGNTWNDYKFTNEEVYIKDLATIPSDTSLKFIMIARDNNNNQKVVTLDFTSFYPRQCELAVSDSSIVIGGDYEYFTPKHPNEKSGCVFGHKSKYLRRIENADCFVGGAPLSLGFKVESNCPCTREDYECDYNYELTISGTCKLVKGLESRRGDEVCLNEDTNIWYEPTGYRKLLGSTCVGGLVLDQWESHVCPGKSVEFKLGGLAMFFVIFVPLTVFAGSLVFIYEKGIRRNGGFSRFGVIRLDDDDEIQLIEENATDKVVNTIVRFGVYVFRLAGRSINGIQKSLNRFRGPSEVRQGTIGAFFNDMVDEEAEDIFGGIHEDEDAREIDNLIQGDEDVDFNDFEVGNPITGHYMDNDNNASFKLDDDAS